MKITDCNKTALIMMRVWDEDFGHWGADISNDYFVSDFRGRISGSDVYVVKSVDETIEYAREWEAKKLANRIAEFYFLDEHYTDDTIIWY